MLEEAFWRAIQETPEDDAPRLIYADWLDDQGDPRLSARAEFIRVQCELARLPKAARTRRLELEGRELELWSKHGKAWCAPLRPFSRKFTFLRGFPDQVLVQASTFLQHAEAVLSAAPVFSIRLRNSKEHVPALAEFQPLERLVSLSLYWNHIGMRRARVFFASPHLGSLRELDLNDNGILPAGLRALFAAAVPRLTALNLRGNDLGDASGDLLAGSELLGQLRCLGLAANGMTDTGVRALATSPRAANLTSLDLSDNRGVGDPGMVALASSPHLAGLTRLNLSQTRFGDAGAVALASSPHLAGLTWLDLSRTELGDAGAAALVESPYLRNLQELHVTSWHFWARTGPAAREALVKRFGKDVCVFH